MEDKTMDMVNPHLAYDEDINLLDIDAAIGQVFLNDASNLNLSLLGRVLKYFLIQTKATKEKDTQEKNLLNIKLNDLYNSNNYLRGRDFRLAESFGHTEDIGQAILARMSALEASVAQLTILGASRQYRSSQDSQFTPEKDDPNSDNSGNESDADPERKKIDRRPTADPSASQHSFSRVSAQSERLSAPNDRSIQDGQCAKCTQLSDTVQALEARMMRTQSEMSTLMGLTLGLQDRMHLVSDVAQTASERASHVLTIESHPVVRALDVKLFELGRAHVDLQHTLATNALVYRRLEEKSAAIGARLEELADISTAQGATLAAAMVKLEQATTPIMPYIGHPRDPTVALPTVPVVSNGISSPPATYQHSTRPNTVKAALGAPPSAHGSSSVAATEPGQAVQSAAPLLQDDNTGFMKLSGVSIARDGEHPISRPGKTPFAPGSSSSQVDHKKSIEQTEEVDGSTAMNETHYEDLPEAQNSFFLTGGADVNLIEANFAESEPNPADSNGGTNEKQRRDMEEYKFVVEDRLGKIERKLELIGDADFSTQNQLDVLDKRMSLDIGIIKRQLALKVNISSLSLSRDRPEEGSSPRHTLRRLSDTRPHPPDKPLGDTKGVNARALRSTMKATEDAKAEPADIASTANHSALSGQTAMSTLSLLLGAKADMEMVRGVEEYCIKLFEELKFTLVHHSKALEKLGSEPESKQRVASADEAAELAASKLSAELHGALEALETRVDQIKMELEALRLERLSQTQPRGHEPRAGTSDLEELNSLVLYHSRQLANHKAWIARNARMIDGLTASLENQRKYSWSDSTVIAVKKQIQNLEMKADLQRALSSKAGEQTLRKFVLELLNKLNSDLGTSPGASRPQSSALPIILEKGKKDVSRHFSAFGDGT